MSVLTEINHPLRRFQVEFAQFSSALVAGMEKGWLNPVVGKEYAMSEIQQAHIDLTKAHGAYDKIVQKII